MNRTRSFSIRLAVTAVIATITLIGGSASAVAAPNNSAAKACQKGGWMELASIEDPTAALADQGACVSYAAKGGTLVPLQPPAPQPSIRVTIGPFDGQFCRVDAEVLNAADVDAYYEVRLWIMLEGHPTEAYFNNVIVPGFTSAVMGMLSAGEGLTSPSATAYYPATDMWSPLEVDAPLDAVCGP